MRAALDLVFSAAAPVSDDLVIDFGSTFGLWLRNRNTEEWKQLHTLGVKSIVTGDLNGNGIDEVVVDFGGQFGIWVWANNSDCLPAVLPCPRSSLWQHLLRHPSARR